MATDHSTSSAPLTIFARKDLPSRRRLAPNVVCMFADERPPVQQARRRGRYPKAVASLSSARQRRYVDSLPKPRDFRVGDYVDVHMSSGAWVPAIIAKHLSTSQDGMKKFLLLGDEALFRFNDSISQYCEAWETALRPA